MNLVFPSRFLKKLEIYQQIRSGQGISKHKKLWRYEAVVLQAFYGIDHQHLNSFAKFDQLKDWVRKYLNHCEIENNIDENLKRALGNLYWRGLIELEKIEEGLDQKEKGKETENKKSIKVLISRQTNFPPIEDRDLKALRIRVTPEALEIAEVVDEVYNRNGFISFINKYKYNLILDIIWLIILIGLSDFLLDIKFKDVLLSNPVRLFYLQVPAFILIFLLILVVWPLFMVILRYILQLIESTLSRKF